jgi:hypothetical protein
VTRIKHFPAIVPSEDQEQIDFISYLDTRPELKYSAIPNSTYSPHMSVKVKNKKLGLRAGLPDMLVLYPGKWICFVEMKKIKNSKTYPHQQEWIDAINTVPGIEARICKGAAEAVRFIEELSPSAIGKQWLSSSVF